MDAFENAPRFGPRNAFRNASKDACRDAFRLGSVHGAIGLGIAPCGRKASALGMEASVLELRRLHWGVDIGALALG